MSLAATLETDIVNVAKKVKAGLEAAEGDAVKVASFLQSNSSEITALAGLAGSGSFATVGLSLVTLAINAVKSAGEAGAQNGLSVSLDSAVIAEVKSLIAAIEKI